MSYQVNINTNTTNNTNYTSTALNTGVFSINSSITSYINNGVVWGGGGVKEDLIRN
jgi:hypothetical protein